MLRWLGELGEEAGTSQWGGGNVLVRGKFHGIRVPWDEPIPKMWKQEIRAKPNGLEQRGSERKGAYPWREMLNKADLSSNSHTEHTRGHGDPQLTWAYLRHQIWSLRQHVQPTNCCLRYQLTW